MRAQRLQGTDSVEGRRCECCSVSLALWFGGKLGRSVDVTQVVRARDDPVFLLGLTCLVFFLSTWFSGKSAIGIA